MSEDFDVSELMLEKGERLVAVLPRCFDIRENRLDVCHVRFVDKEDGSTILRIINMARRTTYVSSTDVIRKTVFLTREEAETALKIKYQTEEIFKEIGKIINEYLDGRSYRHEFLTKIAELKKKYTEDDNL